MIKGIPGQYWLLGKSKIVASEKLDLKTYFIPEDNLKVQFWMQ
jgi:hypothetical protein